MALLDAAARSTITELYGLRFRPPGRRPARGLALARGLAWATRGAAQLLELGPLSLLRGRERPLPAEALSREQRALAEHLKRSSRQTGAPARRSMWSFVQVQAGRVAEVAACVSRRAPQRCAPRSACSPRRGPGGSIRPR